MNILFINEFQVLENEGGVQRITQILADFFNGNGINTFFIFQKTEKEYINTHYKLPNLTISSVDNQKFLEKIVSLNDINLIINQDGFNKEIAKLLSENQTNVPIISCLHSCPNFEIENAKVELKNGLSTNNTFLINLKIILKPFYLFLLKQNLRHKLRYIHNKSTVIVLLSEKFLPVFLDLSKFKNSKKILAISNAIDPKFSEFEKNTFNNSKSIIYVGRLNKGKRVNLLLQIWSQLQSDFPDWNFNIIGDGPELNNLVQLSNSLSNKNIIFHGHSNKVNQHYKNSSIFVSTSAFEGLPMVLIESQSFGTVPIVYNTYESITDLILDEVTGYIVPDLNEKLFLNKLKKLMESDSNRLKMSQKSLQFSQNFKIDIVGRKWLNLFNYLKIEL